MLQQTLSMFHNIGLAMFSASNLSAVLFDQWPIMVHLRAITLLSLVSTNVTENAIGQELLPLS
jgi:hypothetical protein